MTYKLLGIVDFEEDGTCEGVWKAAQIIEN